MLKILSYCQNLPKRTFGAAEVLLLEHHRHGVMYILDSGEIEILKGDIQVATTSEPGAVFGEMSVLLDIPHTAMVRAVAPSDVYVVENAAEFLQSQTDLAYQLAKLLSQRLY